MALFTILMFVMTNLCIINPTIIGCVLFMLLQIIILNNIYKKILYFEDNLYYLAYLMSFIYTCWINNTTFNMVLFGLCSDYILDILIFPKYIKYISKNGNELITGFSKSNGLDLKSNEDIIIDSQQIVYVKTGIRIETPKGYFCFITNKSNMCMKGIMVLDSVINTNYTGEIVVMLKNLQSSIYKVHKNEKIAQIVCVKNINLVERIKDYL